MGWGEPVGTSCPGPPTLGSDPHSCSPFSASSPHWGTPPGPPWGRLVGGRSRGTNVLTGSDRYPWPHCRRAGHGGSASSALQSATSFVLFLLFSVSFFASGDPGPGPGSCHHHEQHPPSPSPWRGDRTGQAGAASRSGAITHRSLLLWPGPSAPCPCPAARLSCSPCPGTPCLARGRGGRCPRSARSS